MCRLYVPTYVCRKQKKKQKLINENEKKRGMDETNKRKRKK